MLLHRYQIMRSCWDADPFNRPPFRKVVERIEQQLSDTTKHVGCIVLMLFTFTIQGVEFHSLKKMDQEVFTGLLAGL